MQATYTEGQVIMYILGKARWREMMESRYEQEQKKPTKPKIAPKKSFKEMTGEEAMNWTSMHSGGKF